MKVVSVTRTERELIRSNNGLFQYLKSLATGRSFTPRGWFYEDQTPEWIKEQVERIIKAGNAESQFGDLFNQIEADQWLKYGPQGGVPAFDSPEVKDALDPIFKESKYDNELKLSKYFKFAPAFAAFLFGKPNCLRAAPKSYESVIDDMSERDTLNSNSGLWRFTRRSLVFTEESKLARRVTDILGYAQSCPAILLFRQYHGKLRPVWMYPMSLNLIEFSYSQVIQEAMRKSPEPRVRQHLSPWLGYEDVKKTLTLQWKKGETVCGGDTTKMDAHMRKAQIRLVYEIVKRLFQRKYWGKLYGAMMQVTEIPLLVSPTKKIVGYHGLASGSGRTQLTETILVLFLAWLKNVDKSQGIGDDFYFFTHIDAETMVEWLSELGLPANASKQTVSSTMLKFLQRLNVYSFFSRESKKVLGGYYPIARATESLVYPEKFHSPKKWNSDMDNIRKYMILENTVDDPAFEQFVIFVAKGQKDMVNFANKTDSQLERISIDSRALPGLNPSYNQEKRTKPLASFESIKLVRKKFKKPGRPH